MIQNCTSKSGLNIACASWGAINKTNAGAKTIADLITTRERADPSIRISTKKIIRGAINRPVSFIAPVIARLSAIFVSSLSSNDLSLVAKNNVNIAKKINELTVPNLIEK